jgi:hypothetical protein
MESKNKRFVNDLTEQLDKEINELDEIINILGDDGSITDSDDANSDLEIMKKKQNIYKDIKGMVKKTSLKMEGFDNEVMLNAREKKVYFKLIKFIMFFRRIFKIK